MSGPAKRRAPTHSGPLTDLLREPGGTLAGLISTARDLAKADRALDGVLDPAVRAHVRVAGIDGGTLTLLADSPTWATRLRYLAPMLREQLDGGAAGALARVRIIARPAPQAERVELESTPASLSPDSAALLESIADSLEDRALSESIRRVARHGRGHRPGP